jgi:hypothetical protein
MKAATKKDEGMGRRTNKRSMKIEEKYLGAISSSQKWIRKTHDHMG